MISVWRNKTRGKNSIGLIAGAGQFPLLFAQAASAMKRKVITIGVEGYTDKKVREFSSESHFVDMGSLGRVVDILKKSGVKDVVLAGSIPKKRIYDPSFKLDQTARSFIAGSSNKGDDHLLRAFQLFLKVHCGVSVIDSRLFLKETIARKEVMTRRAPTAGEWADLRLGWKVAKGIGKMDIGQTVVVKGGVVLAVEALEGTDSAIRRGGELGRGETVVVKVSKPNQSLRFDLPCVGEETLESLKSASSRVLGIEAGKTIMIFKDKLIEKADRENLTLVGL